MERSLVSWTIVSPIERIRGEEHIGVAISATFRIGGVDYTVPGFASCLRAEEVSETINKALTQANNNLEFMLEKYPIPKSNPKVLNEVFKSLVQPKLGETLAGKTKIIEADPKITNKKSYIDRLQGPADQVRQNVINNLCETLGIDPINILEAKWTMLEALALEEELKVRTTSFESN